MNAECLEKLLNADDEQQEIVSGIRQRQLSRVHVLKPPAPRSELKCPICKSNSAIRRGDVTSLTKNYAVLNCKLKADAPSTSTSVGNAKRHYCPEHDHDQRVFCKDCKMVICVYCQLYGSHKGHECALAADLVKPTMEILESAEVTLNDNMCDIVGAESAVKAAVDRLKSSQQEGLGTMQHYFSTVVELLEKEKEKHIRELNHWMEEQLDVLQAQLQ